MTADSVESLSICKNEWVRGLKYKKPIIPILLHADAEMPFGLGSRQYIDFTSPFEPSIEKLRDHLFWLSSPAGVLQAMKDRLADNQRALRRAKDAHEQARIQDDIALLKSQIAEQEQIVADPQGAAKRVEESIAWRLERERQPEKPTAGLASSKFINPPPGVAPTYFQDRHFETKLIGDFLKDEHRRLMIVVGRGGVGKTAMVCRLLKALENGRLPEDGGPLPVEGIVYLSATGTRRVTTPNLYADLAKLLPSDAAEKLDTLYKNPQVSTEAKMQALLAAFPQGRTVLLLDNFEDVIDATTLDIRDAELNEALRAILRLPQHAVKVIVTTRIAPRSLALVQPARQTRIDLDEGLPSPFAENILREMDLDGKVGLKSAPQSLLDEARQRTRGYPRAMEALFALLSADRDTGLQEVVNETSKLLPENVVEVLVGEAFSRLEPAAQRVMQALAIYARPVTPTAVDYLLQPFMPGVNSAPVLNRLVNMQFARKEAGSYYLHPIDREYALSQVPRGEPADRKAEPPPLTQIALQHRGAEYFQKARLPRAQWKQIEDLAPQLAEFELRCVGDDYETAALVLETISEDYLGVWGYHRLDLDLAIRLRGKISDPELILHNANRLGGVYSRLGMEDNAFEFAQEALQLAREAKNASEFGVALTNIGTHYHNIGETARAIGYYKESLTAARESGNGISECRALYLLGLTHLDLAEAAPAMQYLEQSLLLARNLNKQYDESLALYALTEILVVEGRLPKALERVTESARIAADLQSPRRLSYSHGTIAEIELLRGNLRAARRAAEVAGQHDVPVNNPSILALLGVIALREQESSAIREAFVTAVVEAEKLHGQNLDALHAKALALSGLALCEDRKQSLSAINAYRKARAINKDTGVVARCLRLFDALAVADTNGILEPVRKAAAGE